MRRSLILLLFTCCHLQVNAQQKSKDYLRIDYQLTVDNDVFTLDFHQDQYYTSGIYPSVRILLDSAGDTKRIRTYQLNHRIYTPSDVRWSRPSQMDRPYAGLLSLSASNEYYFLKQAYLKVELDLGWMGPASGVDESQIAYHGWFGMPTPSGWKYQISNSPIINLYSTYIKRLLLVNKLEISSESNLGAGTIFNYLRQNMIFRIGDIRPLNASSFTGSRLGFERTSKKSPQAVESYFFYSPAIEFVAYNSTIEGSFIGKDSPLTMEVNHWIIQHRFGIMFSWSRFDMGFTYYRRTPENKEAHYHDYVGIRLNQRF